MGLSLLAQVHFASCLRPEQFQKAVEEASAKTVEPDTPTLYCCHDWVAKENKCYPHDCPSANDLPLLASGFCPQKCCSEARGDCPPSDPSFLEEGSTGQAEKVKTKKLYCCYDSTVGRNQCFKDQCYSKQSQPKEGWACPDEC